MQFPEIRQESDIELVEMPSLRNKKQTSFISIVDAVDPQAYYKNNFQWSLPNKFQVCSPVKNQISISGLGFGFFKYNDSGWRKKDYSLSQLILIHRGRNLLISLLRIFNCWIYQQSDYATTRKKYNCKKNHEKFSRLKNILSVW